MRDHEGLQCPPTDLLEVIPQKRYYDLSSFHKKEGEHDKSEIFGLRVSTFSLALALALAIIALAVTGGVLGSRQALNR